MNSWGEPDISARDQARARRVSGHAGSPELAHAVAEREQGLRRLNTTTVTVSLASVVVAGVVMAVLPASTHAAVKISGTSDKSASSGASSSSKPSSTPSSASSSTPASSSSTPSSSSDSSGSSSNSGTLQAPATTPVQSIGGGSTSGGS